MATAAAARNHGFKVAASAVDLRRHSEFQVAAIHALLYYAGSEHPASALRCARLAPGATAAGCGPAVWAGAAALGRSWPEDSWAPSLSRAPESPWPGPPDCPCPEPTVADVAEGFEFLEAEDCAYPDEDEEIAGEDFEAVD